MCLFDSSQQSLHHRQLYVNETAMAVSDKANSNTKDGILCENSNAIDLLTKKPHLRHLIPGPDFISGR